MAKHKRLPNPPYPPTTSAAGFSFGLDYRLIEQSDTWALASPDVKPWLLMLWFRAWQQIPCGAYLDDDRVIAARIGMSLARFKANRTVLLRGWWRASDGRLYHPHIAAMVKERMDWRSKEAARKQAWRMSRGTDTGQTRDSNVCDDTGAGAGAGAFKTTPLPPATDSPNPTTGAPATERRGAADSCRNPKPKRVPRTDDPDALARYGNSIGVDAMPGEDAHAYQSRIFDTLEERKLIARGKRTHAVMRTPPTGA